MSVTVGCPFCDWQGAAELLDHHLSQPHPQKERTVSSTPVSNETALKVIAFVIVVIPLLVPVNVLLWRIALGGA